MWLNGKQHGEGAYYDVNGAAKRGLWDNGKRIKWIDEGPSDSSQQKAEDVQQTN